jgi:hypothetical protein
MPAQGSDYADALGQPKATEVKQRQRAPIVQLAKKIQIPGPAYVLRNMYILHR